MPSLNGVANGDSAADGEPVCLIRGGQDGLSVDPDGLRLLSQLNEPVAVVCLAGQYRTGKSFFLNQLANSKKTRGFRVGPTTESCTRGIWLWDPIPTVRSPDGVRVVFMDTEGMAATDNDESFDAKIFSLGLLLSSLFVFNTMGVIDEGAIDRLYLVSELTKHVCLSADTTAAGGGRLTQEDEADQTALAPHFPPFVWLLRDFMLEMQADGTSLTPNEYLEKSLEPRDGGSRRNEDRNRIRQSIRVLFDQRECLTLVRPVMDETQLRYAAELAETELRPEFVTQMAHVRHRILSVVTPKLLFGKALDGAKLALLVQCYTDTLNSGSVPDIKAAWAYVSEATCQTAMLQAMELYDTHMAPGNYIEEGEEDGSTKPTGATPLLTQQEFEKLHKDAQDEALNLFKNVSIEGPTRAACFQKVKIHVQKQKTAMVAALQRTSSALCEHVLQALKAELLTQPLANGAWDDRFLQQSPMQFAETFDALEQRYDANAQGPAQKVTFFNFLRNDVVQFHEQLVARLAHRHDVLLQDVETRRAQLQHAKETTQAQLQHQIREKEGEIQRLLDAKAHAEDKDRLQQTRIQELQTQTEQQHASLTTLEAKHQHVVETLEETQRNKNQVELDLEKTRTTLAHTKESLELRDNELRHAKLEWAADVDKLRTQHQGEKEEWIQKLADQTADKAAVQKTLKQRDHELQQQMLAMEMVKKENQQLTRELDAERDAREQTENECDDLRTRHIELETQLEETYAQHMRQQDDAERERQRLEARLARFETQLGRVEADRDVEDVLRDCVAEVVRLAEVDKANVLLEERNVLQERLGELYLKISVLPEFYQREIFCSPDPEPSFFDALTK